MVLHLTLRSNPFPCTLIRNPCTVYLAGLAWKEVFLHLGLGGGILPPRPWRLNLFYLLPSTALFFSLAHSFLYFCSPVSSEGLVLPLLDILFFFPFFDTPSYVPSTIRPYFFFPLPSRGCQSFGVPHALFPPPPAILGSTIRTLCPFFTIVLFFSVDSAFLAPMLHYPSCPVNMCPLRSCLAVRSRVPLEAHCLFFPENTCVTRAWIFDCVPHLPAYIFD